MNCKSISQDIRLAWWAFSNRQIPPGKRLGWVCAMAYCARPDHACIVPDRTAHQREWGRIAKELAELPISGKVLLFCEDRAGLRSAMAMRRELLYKRFSFRSRGLNLVEATRLEDREPIVDRWEREYAPDTNSTSSPISDATQSE